MVGKSTSSNFYPPFVTSNYKLGLCEGCGKHINRGDEITEVVETAGMELRYREHINGSFYKPCTGKRFVHKNCIIEDEDGCFWTLWEGHTTDPNDFISEPISEKDLFVMNEINDPLEKINIMTQMMQIK